MKTLAELMEDAEKIRSKYEEYNALTGNEAWRIRDYAMGFGGDFGDLQKLIMAKENLRKADDVDARLGHELADCLWSILVIANYYGIDLDKEFSKTMDTITKRIEDKTA
ncbi:MAG TPA: MazG nucleotide pyrophosphohydrolase domain-containing protein [Candidatus Saccharimonadales bacterium]|jgi:NTP pyrophosphatase (non-canonical NTP hydrolase)